jgi:signal transduction histidine kinase
LINANTAIVKRARAQAGNLAHSLKTPLALLMDVGVNLNAHGDQQTGQTIIRLCEKMTLQINHQMAQARATAARSSMTLASKIRPSLESIVGGISQLYESKNLMFEAIGDLDLTVSCDSRDLDEILGNLIDNAAKWAASSIRISVRKETDFALVIIEDDGPGLPAEARTRVFEIGERLDESVPGTGLGLAIVKDFIELYRGKIWISVSAMGGASVSFELPLAGTNLNQAIPLLHSS